MFFFVLQNFKMNTLILLLCKMRSLLQTKQERSYQSEALNVQTAF